MFDILGFRALLSVLGLSGLTARVKHLEGDLRMHFQWEARSVMFSDTILLYSAPLRATGDEGSVWAREGYVDAFLRWCAALQAMSLRAELPMRGGVALGECVLAPSRGRFLGQPIVDAYVLSERQDWIGVALHESCLPLRLRHEPADAAVTVQTKIPLKGVSPAPDGWTLDWPRMLPEHRSLREALRRQVDENRDTCHSARWLRTWDYFEARASIPRQRESRIYLQPDGAG